MRETQHQQTQSRNKRKQKQNRKLSFNIMELSVLLSVTAQHEQQLLTLHDVKHPVLCTKLKQISLMKPSQVIMFMFVSDS